MLPFSLPNINHITCTRERETCYNLLLGLSHLGTSSAAQAAHQILLSLYGSIIHHLPVASVSLTCIYVCVHKRNLETPTLSPVA